MNKAKYYCHSTQLQQQGHPSANSEEEAFTSAVTLPVHANSFAALADVRYAELSADGGVLSEPSPVDLFERYYALIADLSDAWHDAIFGCGRSSYDSFWAYDEAASSRSATAAAATAACSSRSEELAALDALIATYTANDPPASKAADKACAAGGGSALQDSAGGCGSRAPKEATGQQLAGESGVSGVCSFSAAAVPKQRSSDAGRVQQPGAAAVQRASPYAAEDELQISADCFAALQDALVTPCTVDACAAEDGSNALLPNYCCAGNKTFFARKFQAGDFLWLHTPRQHRELFLTRYRLLKVQCPQLGACILLPAKYSSLVLRGMTQFTRYARNTPLFTDTTSGQTAKAKCDFVVWIDKPQFVAEQPEQWQPSAAATAAAAVTDDTTNVIRPKTTHTMQLTGTIGGAPACVLIDSGAEPYNYSSAAF
jgi:hypothetical protein